MLTQAVWTFKNYKSGSWDRKLFKREAVFNLARKTFFVCGEYNYPGRRFKEIVEDLVRVSLKLFSDF